MEDRSSNRRFFLFNAVVSALALSLLAWLLLLRSVTPGADVDVRFLPAVNACLNATSAVLLSAGWIAIKRRRPDVHRYLMVSAFVSSALFLVSYVAYHYVHGDTRYPGHDWLRPIYFFVLISHVLLSIGVVPLALSAFWFAYRRRFDRHKRVTRVLLPIWLYVSATGVVIFLLLRAAARAAS
jgi:putative membrane protein